MSLNRGKTLQSAAGKKQFTFSYSFSSRLKKNFCLNGVSSTRTGFTWLVETPLITLRSRQRRWVDTSRREHEALLAEEEANRIVDLNEKCRRKGLDFDTENRKVLDRRARTAKRKNNKME
jgi:hypothetical protein